MAGSKYTFLKPDLKLEIDRIQAHPGDILVFRPKHRSQRFTQEYLEWLQEQLAELLAPGVRAMIISEDHTEINKVAPSQSFAWDTGVSLNDAYRKGWDDAIRALEEATD